MQLAFLVKTLDDAVAKSSFCLHFERQCQKLSSLPHLAAFGRGQTVTKMAIWPMGYFGLHCIMNITWDEIKADKNVEKHEVSFEEAATVFFTGPVLCNQDDEQDRMKTIGFSSNARLLLVVTFEQDGDEVRIITARKADRHEKEEFEKRVRF
jgi:uncharacterized DUF497 family protein